MTERPDQTDTHVTERQLRARWLIGRIALGAVLISSMARNANAHTIGLAEQVLQPVTAVHTALPVLAMALMLRQQEQPALSRDVAIALAAGLATGFALWLAIGPSPRWLVVALVTAITLGVLTAWGRTWAAPFILAVATALGAGIGTNLLTETHDAFDFTTSLAGVFIGTLAVLQIAVTLPQAPARRWQAVGERIAGSWIVAIATLIVALEVRQFF